MKHNPTDAAEVKRLMTERLAVCRRCAGTGRNPGCPDDACALCGGSGLELDFAPLLTEPAIRRFLDADRFTPAR
jgi:hypothetical protein